MKRATEDQQIQELVLNPSNNSLQFTTVPIPTADATIICDISTGSPRPLVPAQFRKLVFDSLHSLSHPGIGASHKLNKDKYVWRNINSDVCRWAHTCLQCQKSKVHRHNVTPLGLFSHPDSKFDGVHIDNFGPLPPSDGYTYISIDCSTRWSEVIPISNIKAETVAKAFLKGWIYHFGSPSMITTDCVCQFTSLLWKHLTHLYDIPAKFVTEFEAAAWNLKNL